MAEPGADGTSGGARGRVTITGEQDRPSGTVVRRLLRLSIPAILVGVVSALILFAVDEISGLAEDGIWTTLPAALGIDPSAGWWIFGVLSVTGLVVGLILLLVPGHGGRDSATTELIAPPLPLKALPSLALVAVIGLAGGVSLGPENPIIAINTGILVALLARLWPAIPPNLVVMLAASATIGALFGTPVAAALIFTGVVGTLGGEGALWDKLFLPLLAAAAGSLTMALLAHPSLAVPLPAYDSIAGIDLLSAAVIAAVAAGLGIAAASVFPALHGAFRMLRNPVFYVTLGGILLGILGAVGGPITLFKGLQQTGELAMNRADYSAGQLALIVAVKLVALVIAAAAGFRGGRIFPAVFIGTAVGVLANALIPSIPVTVAIAAGVMGMVLAIARDGWIALFIAVAVAGSITVLAVLCIAILPVWLMVSRAPEMIVHPPAPKSAPPLSGAPA
ncbi:ion channel protein [Herbiconiux sp.]|uniref:ion channel protein n=1 Tax=Herbiconiux sp. TaxID=1871186 RepID=UPI0025C4B657|nr:ion channel protein [Herbiconiux sp.]